ncbi:MAG: hypothetical protein JSV44_04290 [Candidatus Zixiibacteriota bacterium]|nr:MAG: hypothetical protein JSV44_04290 [candidate division Zixibacteria bacterium]
MSKRQHQALINVNFDLFLPVDMVSPDFPEDQGSKPGEGRERIDLPPVRELYRLFDLFNRECFGGKLPLAKISYSDRMLIAGSYLPTTVQIKIGKKYHQVFPDDLEDTLKHEMIHILHPRHDRGFKVLAGKLGVSLKAKSHPDLRGSYKYLYVCPSCGRDYPRRKRLKMASCGVCSARGSFDPHFKLRLAHVKK